MPAMAGLRLRRVVAAALCCAALAAVTLGSPVLGPEPFRCAPCTQERLSACPAVAPGCAEVVRESGCGCCVACALKRGEMCGIYTAPCGAGLKCTPRPDDPRPLHALTRGQAVCAEVPAQEPVPELQTQGRPRDFHPHHLLLLPAAPLRFITAFITHHLPPSDQEEPEAEMDNTAGISDTGLYLSGLSKPYDPRAAADAQESMKAKLIAIRKIFPEQGPCLLELQTAMEKIAKSQQKLGDKLTRFYLPNCDKRGFYKPKQCDSSLDGQRGPCWCVNSWNGKKILGSTDLPVDAECP
ncbi:Insulin-like growth factor-binding protein 1 [Oryzias melastigma]|uniref:Insulin-like growth factor-binding protein 1 n=1 Tax=Oryzias melastigma TaxID=30732 RepID=A0A834KWF2_ORYME|nr:Insulin-like growth factor-binding protein 1 [Oryzias melastigma]